MLNRIMTLKHASNCLLSVFFLGMTACAYYPQTEVQWQSELEMNHPLVGHIIKTDTQHSISDSQLVEELAEADYVLIGEKHDNPDHHLLQNWLLTQLLPNAKYQVTYEMMTYDQQSQLDTLNASSLTSDIATAANFQTSGWAPQMYLPLLQTSLNKGATISGGNLPKEQIMTLYSANPASLKPANRFTTMNVLNDAQMLTLDKYIFEQHCELMPMSQVGPMSKIQIAKDASLAFSMVNSSAPKNILITGNFHANKTLGVPVHLAQLEPKATSLIVQIVEVEPGKTEPSDYLKVDDQTADYLWFTPKWSNRDYCDDIKAKGNQL
ncbi:ChaN family lipoprotein [Litoribacillus peritrichatus]|uniref:ChaN family lipoprotein n=1 Tax=Litoribacillus peritrichatus TaxID=718191 RepID=A0ABP7M6P2_9GAMM